MADHDLTTRLLASDHHSQSSDEPHLIINVDGKPGLENFNRNSHQNPSNHQSNHQSDYINSTQMEILENPYELLGAKGYVVPESSTVDPFKNNTARIEGVYEWLKIVVCLPIALIRLVLFGLCLSVGYVATKFALHGWKDKENPMPI